jgi:hypothetical protein
MNLFYDQKGRIHDKTVSEADPYPCNNSFLYTGEASLIGVPVSLTDVQMCWTECQQGYGYNRNPNGKLIPASSHDEVVGMMMLLPRMNCLEIYNEYKKQHFQVCNLPEFKPKPLYKLNPIKVILQMRALSREESPRKATPNYPYIMPITFRHAPQHTYFYKRCAGLKPGLIHTLFFVLSSLFTVFKGDSSGKVMLGFKLKKLSNLGLGLGERLVNMVYNKKVNLADEVNEYFPHEGHPIRLKINGQT